MPGARRPLARNARRAGENSRKRRVSALPDGHRKTPMQPGRRFERRGMRTRAFTKPETSRRQDQAACGQSSHPGFAAKLQPKRARSRGPWNVVAPMRKPNTRIHRQLLQGSTSTTSGQQNAIEQAARASGECRPSRRTGRSTSRERTTTSEFRATAKDKSPFETAHFCGRRPPPKRAASIPA